VGRVLAGRLSEPRGRGRRFVGPVGGPCRSSAYAARGFLAVWRWAPRPGFAPQPTDNDNAPLAGVGSEVAPLGKLVGETGSLEARGPSLGVCALWVLAPRQRQMRGAIESSRTNTDKRLGI
jgi:hypothetical protein